MARISSKNNISGAVGALVFVIDGKRSYVRTKPEKVRQSAATKASSAVFGKVSEKEKTLRLNLLGRMNCPAPQYFAARHRGRLRKTTITGKDSNNRETVKFERPEALVGFNFNPNRVWNSATNFQITTIKNDNTSVAIKIPELAWGQQIKAVAGAQAAQISFHAFSVNLNTEPAKINEVSVLKMKLGKSKPEAEQIWTIEKPEAGNWLLVTGCLSFDAPSSKMADCFSAAYLWASS